MQFNIFSYAFIVIILCIFIKDFNKPLETIFKHVLIFGLILSFNTNLGNFVELGTSSVGYMFIINLILLAIGFVLIFSKKNYNFKIIKIGTIAVISVTLGILFAIIMPYSGGIIIDYDAYVGGDLTRVYDLTVSRSSFQFLINMVCFFIIASTIYNTYTKKNLIKTLSFILNTSVVIFASVFILELFGNYFLRISMSEHIFIPIFGYSHPTSINIDRFHGLFKETSHYALALFFLSLLCIVDVNLKKQSKNVKGIQSGIIRFLLFVILLAASTSFIGIFYLIVSLLLYIVFNAKLKIKKLSCVLVGLFALIFLCAIGTGHGEIIPKYERFEKLFNSFVRLINGEQAVFSSEGARLTSMYEMLILVAARPFFGIGAALVDAHSTILSMLGTIGIVGTGLWILAMVKIGRIKKQHWIFVLSVIVALTFSGGNGGLLELRFLYLFTVIGCVSSKVNISQQAAKLIYDKSKNAAVITKDRAT